MVTSCHRECRFRSWRCFDCRKLCYFSYLLRASWYFGHAMWKHAADSGIFPRVYVCIGRFTPCLLSLQMETDRGWSFTGTGKALLAVGAVTAGVRICIDRVWPEALMAIWFSQEVLYAFSGFLMRDRAKKQRKTNRNNQSHLTGWGSVKIKVVTSRPQLQTPDLMPGVHHTYLLCSFCAILMNIWEHVVWRQRVPLCVCLRECGRRGASSEDCCGYRRMPLVRGRHNDLGRS